MDTTEKWYSKPKTKDEAKKLISIQKKKLPKIKSDRLFEKSNKDVIVENALTRQHTVPRYRTPSPKKCKKRSTSPTFSPLSPTTSARLKAALESPKFVEKRNSLTTVLEKAKKDAMKHPKCKFSRALMNGYECRCCKGYYDAMGLEGEARREYVNKASKHRGWEERPPTPPRYWDLDVPSKEEQVQLGWVIETDSPLFKKKKK